MACKILLCVTFNENSNVISHHLTPPSFKCTPTLRVGGSARQQLHHQRVLGASTPDRPERPHTGVQGETRDAQDRSGSGDGREIKEVEQTVLAVWEFVLVPTFLLIH